MNKKLTTIAFIALAMILAFTSCGQKGKNEIDPEFSRHIAGFTYGQISTLSPIQIELTQDISSVELEKEIDQSLFKFSPSIKGKAYWTSTRAIKFVPEAGELKAGQKYDAWFKLNKVLEVEPEYNEFYFKFNTAKQGFNVEMLPYSPIKDNDIEWNSAQGTLMLADDADLAKIEKMFTIAGPDKTAKVKITPSGQNGKYNILVDSLRRSKKDVSYTLTVNGKSIEAQTDARTIELAMPATGASTFKVLDVRTMYDPKECVRITFSEPLSLNQNIQGIVRIGNGTNFSYDIQKNVLKLYLNNSSSSNSTVDVKIYPELKSASKQSIDKYYSYSLSFEQNKPEIKMTNSGTILPDAENLTIPISAVNLWAVDVKVIKIFENNILNYLQSNNLGGSSELKRFGRLVHKKRIRLDEDPSINLTQWNTFQLDLSSMINKDPGAMYRIEMSMKQEYSLYNCDGVASNKTDASSMERFNNLTEEDEEPWNSSGYYYYDDYDYNEYNWEDRYNPCKYSYYVNKGYNTVVMASNLGITAKMGQEKKMMVAITDILTAKPMSDVTVDAYNYQMQRIGGGKTNGDGFVDFDYKHGTPFVVVASNGKERGYLKTTSNQSLSLSNFDVSGKKIEKGLQGYIYGERGVWRPGDSLFVTFILEDKNKMLPKNHPVSMQLFTPRGQLHQQHTTTSGQNGFYAFRMATESDAITGDWRALVKVGGASFSKTLKIETVKPNRLKVRLDAGEIIKAGNGSMTANLSSQWLHGAAASNLKAKVEMTLSPSSTPFKGYEEYTFQNPATSFYSDNYTIFDGQLDASGNATVKANLPQAANAPGMLRAHVVSRVFESGGDASINTQSIPYSPFTAYVGIKTPAENVYDWLETDKDNTIDIVSLTPEGKLTARNNINVKVYKLRWSWWWSDSYESLSSYVNNTSSEVIMDKTISTSGGKANVDFRIDYPEWGRYLIMVKDKDSGHTTGKIAYVDWPSYRGRSSKGNSGGAAMLSFSTDKRSYNVGEKVTVILPECADGRALITIEDGSKIISREWVKTSENKDTKYTFKVTEAMAPNFYVSANLLQPHSKENGLPFRMYGVINVNVENKDTKLEPVITMADELRPEKEFSVSVSEKNKKDMTYTLAIVDDGLLDLTNFKTPNAWSDFYARQSLGIRTWDMFDAVVGAKHSSGRLLSIGGGDEDEMKAKDEGAEKKNANRFKPIVKFIGPFTLRGGKTDKHNVTLPSYVGSVRVMVVSGNEKGAYGKTDKSVQIKNPLMILSTLPRVAGPNEEILLPVNVFVMDKKVKNVTVTVESTGLLKFTEATSQTISFNEVGDQVVNFRVKVGAKPGVETVKIKATGGGELANETIEIQVRNPNPPIINSTGGMVKQGETKEYSINFDAIQEQDWAKLEVSRMPSINFNRNLTYLLGYPHGCTEQVTSKVFPLLFVKNFVDVDDKEKAKIEFNIKEGIQILSSRQMSDGGIAYWPGDYYSSEWATTYAGHFLVEAQRAGRDVPKSVLDKWKAFQKKTAQNWNMRDLHNSYYHYSMSDLQQAYRLYTLALAGDAELGAMNRMKEMKGLSTQARWRLAAAYLIAGKKDAANQLIAGASDQIEAYSFSNNTFGSSARDMAMIMETYLLMGDTEKALSLSHKVASALNDSHLTTQTSAYGLVAMSKLSEKMGKGILAYELEVNGVSHKKANSGRVFEEITLKPQDKITATFKNIGQGEIYVRLLGRTQPLEDKSPSLKNGVGVQVRYTDLDGRPIDVTSLRQGTEFYANVVIQNVSGQYITDLALTHIFASGWEIFNERLFGDQAKESHNYEDIRDDRVLTYFNLSAGHSAGFKVKLQAAYCGRFYLPGIGCEAMYSPGLQGRTVGQWVEVKH